MAPPKKKTQKKNAKTYKRNRRNRRHSRRTIKLDINYDEWKLDLQGKI
jgi:hypothetical protein